MVSSPGLAAWGACIVALLLCPVTLGAHAELLEATPPADAVLDAAPQRVRLRFSEPVDAVGDSIVVVAPSGVRVDMDDSRTSQDDATSLVASLDARELGTYVVAWRAISADSHPISGSYSFSVGTRTRAAAVGPPASGTGLLLVQAAVRWAHLAGLLGLCGPLVIRTLRGRLREAVPTSLLWRFHWRAACLLLGAAVLALAVQAAALTARLSAAFSPSTIESIIDTGWGIQWGARVLLVGLLLLTTREGCRRAERNLSDVVCERLLVLGTAGLLWLTTMNGHAATASPSGVMVAVDMLHLSAASIWLGGLTTLAVVIFPMARRQGLEAERAVWTTLGPRFSAVATTMVIVLGLTGTYEAWYYVGTLNNIVAPGYGRTLLAKLATIGVLAIPAAFHFRVVGWAGHHPQWRMERARTLRWSLAAEALLGFAVLGLVGLLTSQPPARAHALTGTTEETPVLTLHAQGRDLHATLLLTPARAGSNRVQVDLTSLSGRTVPNVPVRFRIEPPPGTGIDGWTVVPARTAPAVFTATVVLAPPGEWRFVVSVDSPSGPLDLDFALSIPPGTSGR